MISKLKELEAELIHFFKNALGSNLVSVLVEGSYGSNDAVAGYSDYDLIVFVKNADGIPAFNLNRLSKEYSLEIQYVILEYSELLNRIQDNNKATRFLSNIDLIRIKTKTRLLAGKNFFSLIPPVSKIIKRDLNSDLREYYYHATNPDPDWNIFIREPPKWINYIINMSNALLLSQGVRCQKDQIPSQLKKYFPEFKAIKYIKEALLLRKTEKVLRLTISQKKLLRKTLLNFLEEHKRIIF